MDSQKVRDAKRDARLDYMLGRRSNIAWYWPTAEYRETYQNEWLRWARLGRLAQYRASGSLPDSMRKR